MWANSRYLGLDLALSPRTLAGAIHWLIERRFWRTESHGAVLEELYSRSTERIRAAARVVARNLSWDPMFLSEAAQHLSDQDWTMLRDLHRAHLYGVAPSNVEPAVAMLANSSG